MHLQNPALQITELTLFANDIPVVKNFYSGILSLNIIDSSDTQISFQAGSTKLTFKKNYSDSNFFYHFAFNIPSNKLEEAKEWINGKAKLLPISENNFIADFENWNAKSIYFLDSAGNIVELIARFDLKNNSDEKFNLLQILSVSEIGIVKNDIPAFRQKLINEYKVSDFVKSNNSDTFSAMGDDNGLFILASENRNWYPTKTPSQKAPFEIKFINDSGEIFTLTDKTM